MAGHGGEQAAGGVTLQLTNPHGDVIAYADNTTTATGVTAYFEQNEYGVPRATNTTYPKRYGWLGAKQRSRDALAGLVLMGVRLYNPSMGRFLTVDPIPGGNANPYVYPPDPVNDVDLSGKNCERGSYCAAPPSRASGGGAGGGGTSARPPNVRHNPDQQALHRLGKEAKRRGGVSRADAEQLVKWAKEYHVPHHGTMTHPNRGGWTGKTEHIKINRMHIPVL